MTGKLKTVLCYGDSNTYGYDPETGLRYPAGIRWTSRLSVLLGEGYHVVEEGCNGRTTVFSDPLEPWKNGRDHLRTCLNSHKPVDYLIVMLGTNDLKEIFHASAAQIAGGAGSLLMIAKEFTEEKQGYVPKMILVSPPQVGPKILLSPFAPGFSEDAVARSKAFPLLFESVAKKNGCAFLDAAAVLKVSELDSLHLTVEGHRVLSEELFRMIRKLEAE